MGHFAVLGYLAATLWIETTIEDFAKNCKGEPNSRRCLSWRQRYRMSSRRTVSITRNLSNCFRKNNAAMHLLSSQKWVTSLKPQCDNSQGNHPHNWMGSDLEMTIICAKASNMLTKKLSFWCSKCVSYATNARAFGRTARDRRWLMTGLICRKKHSKYCNLRNYIL